MRKMDCTKVTELLDRVLYKYWLDQNKKTDSLAAKAEFEMFIAEAKTKLAMNQ